MENNSIVEDVNDLQTHVINMRQKYSNTISKYYEQNNKIELKAMQKLKLQENRFETPKDFIMEDNLIDGLNVELVDKERMNELKNKLINLNKISIQNIRMKNCNLYKKLSEN